MKLMDKTSDGNNCTLREFTDVTAGFKITSRDQHEVLLKVVKTKTTGEARRKLVVRDLTETGERC
jgi:hypothetical protein